MELRPYQKDSIEKIHEAWQKFRSVMFQMPTGTGKTVIFNEIAHGERQQDNHVLIIAHRKELVEQITHRLELTFHEPVGVIMSGYPAHPERLIQVATIQTLRSREYPYKHSSVIIIDEAHHATAETYRRLWEEYPNAKFLGVTATPIRLSGEGFTDLFDFLITSDSISNFIKQGYLSQIKYLGNPQIVPDLTKIATDKGGDFDSNQLSKEMRQEIIMANLTNSYFNHAKDKKIIVFAVDVEHSLSIVNRYQNLGINAEHIDANTPKREREQILERFRKGETRILSNVNIVSEGFDMPDCDGVQLARPTKSLGLYLQQIGRCMRPAKGKDYAIVLDNVGLYEIFGSPKAEKNWSLEPNLSINQATDEAITRLCDSRNRDKPLESNDLNLVILEDVEIMTIDEIKAQIEILTDHKLKLQEQIQILISNNIDELAIKAIQDKIEKIEKEISILQSDLNQALARESKVKIEEVFNECKEFIQMFINDERLNNDKDKIKFVDKIIEFLEKEKSKLSKLDELPPLPTIINSYPPTQNLPTQISENNTSSEEISNDYPKVNQTQQNQNLLIRTKIKDDSTKLKVTFIYTNTDIVETDANDTFVKTIFELGIDDCIRVVEKLNMTYSYHPLVSRQKPPDDYGCKSRKYSYTQKDGYYFVSNNSSTKSKKKNLENIAKELNIPITVEIIPK